MKFVIDDKIPYIRPYIEAIGECTYLPGAQISHADLVEADALIVRTRTKVNKALLEGTKVRLVVTATIGFDHIDTAYLHDAGIRWTNCPGCNATSVAQYVEALLPAHASLGRRGVLGLVGCGHVGSAVKAMAERLGWEVRVSDPPLGMTDDLSEADVITFHVPLTTDGPCPTHHMASDAFFRSLRRKPVVINAARGGVVDEAALLRAMDAGLVGLVAIDTWENEPHIDAELLRRATIATPHIAGYSANGKANATLMTLRAVCEAFGIGEDVVALPSTARALLEEALGVLPDLPPYHPSVDSAALKAAPDKFEYLRGHYPLRLE